MTKRVFLSDYRIDNQVLQYLDKKDILCIDTLKDSRLYSEIDGHPDIVSCKVGKKTVLEEKTYNYIKQKGIVDMENILKGETYLEAKYPKDIAYNVVVTEKYLIGNLKFTDPVILKLADKQGLEKIDVRQGYTRCSTIALNDDLFMTSDKSIHSALTKKGVKSYYIQADDIYLSKRYSGFLGGSAVKIDDEVIFFGDMEKSSSSSCIIEILKKHNLKYKSFKFKWTDFGSMICIF